MFEVKRRTANRVCWQMLEIQSSQMMLKIVLYRLVGTTISFLSIGNEDTGSVDNPFSSGCIPAAFNREIFSVYLPSVSKYPGEFVSIG